jgi:hypothetical protein
MIELYEGRLGGGKTYSAVVRMVDHLRRGGVVCTNVDLRWDAVKAYISQRFRLQALDAQFIPLAADQIGLFHRYTPSGSADLPVLVVLDEAHLTFNARDFAQTDKLYRETLTFLTQSRKVNTDIIFIAQSVLNMDKQFMRLVQFIWRFRDLARWKIPGLGIPYPLKQILAVQFDYDGKTVLQRSFVGKDSRIFALYDTNSLVRPFPRLELAQTKHSLEKAQSYPRMKLLLPIIIVVAVIAAFILYNKMSHLGVVSAPVAAAVNSPNVSSTPSASSSRDEGKKQLGAYDIYSEHFLAWNGKSRSLKTTEGGWYEVGEMSDKGYVTAISDRRARIAQPDGRTGWIVASHDAPRPVLATPTPSPTPSPTPEPQATPTPTTQAMPAPSQTPAIGILNGNRVIIPKP